MKKKLVIENPVSYEERKIFKNVGEEYDIYIGSDVKMLYGNTVFSGQRMFDKCEKVDIYYDGTKQSWLEMKKGTAVFSKEPDWYGSYYHNVPDSYNVRREYNAWIHGYNEITVHCTDGDVDYDAYSDKYNEANSIDV